MWAWQKVYLLCEHIWRAQKRLKHFCNTLGLLDLLFLLSFHPLYGSDWSPVLFYEIIKGLHIVWAYLWSTKKFETFFIIFVTYLMFCFCACSILCTDMIDYLYYFIRKQKVHLSIWAYLKSINKRLYLLTNTFDLLDCLLLLLRYPIFWLDWRPIIF